MKVLRPDSPPQVLLDNYQPVTVGTVTVTEAGKYRITLSVPTIELEFTAVTDLVAPNDVVNLTLWVPR